MAPKSVAALVLLAAMIAGLAPPLQAQTGISFIDDFMSAVNGVCSGNNAMMTCAFQLVQAPTTPSGCCEALLKAVTTGEGKQCACGFRKLAAERTGFDVDQFCQTASIGRVAIKPSKLKEFCTGTPGN